MLLYENGVVKLDTGECVAGTLLLDTTGNPLSVGGSGGTSSTDDGAFTVGASSLTPVGGVVTADSVDSGDSGAFAMLANRQQKITLYDSSGVEITSFGGGTEYVVNAVAPANPTGATFVMERDDALSALTEVEGDWTNPRSNANGALWVAVNGTVTVDGSGVTQPVSNAGLTELAAAINGSSQMDVNLAASNATVTVATHAVTQSGAWSVRLTDGTDTADVLDLTNSNPLTVAIVDTNGDQIASFGGGTQYTENDTDASITGTAMLMEGAANTLLPVQGTTTDGLLVNLGSNNDVTVTGTVTVGSHAVTNAGTFATQVDGAALTALQLIDDPVATLGTTTYTETSTKGMIVGAVRRDADTTLVDTTNEVGPLQMDANGRLKVEAFSGETLPVSLASVPSHAVTNAGTFAVQVDGAALTSLQLIDDAVFTDDTGFTPGTSKGLAVGLQADESSTDSVDEGDFGVPRMTLDRKVITTLQPHTKGGLTTFMASGSDGSSILVATKQTIKASAGQLYGYYLYNPEAAVTFVHIYNTDTVTVGTTNPLLSIAVPAGAAANLSIPQGVLFDTAMSCSATTTAGGNGAPATGVSAVFWYA